MAERDDQHIDPNWTPPVETPPATPPQDDPVEALKRQMAGERQARIQAEQRANEMAQNAHRAQIETADSQLHLINTAIDRVQESTTNLKAAYAEALRVQDFSAAADIQAEMSDNAAKLLQLRNGKAHMEAQPKPQAPQPIRTQPADPVEALASQLTPRSAAWVRAHPEYASDQRLNQRMLAAHNLAVTDGIKPDTDEYFASVEATLGLNRQRALDPEPTADPGKTNGRDTAPPAAPVSRGGGSRRTATLSAEEIEIAELSGMTPEDYAKNRDTLRKEGRLH